MWFTQRLLGLRLLLDLPSRSTSRGETGRDSSEIPVSRAQDDPDLMLEASIRKHLSEVGRSGSERSLRDASDRSIKSQTSSRASKRFTPLADILQHGQAEPKSPRTKQVT